MSGLRRINDTNPSRTTLWSSAMSTAMRGFLGALLGLIVFNVLLLRAVVFSADRLVLRAGFFLDFTSSTRDYTAA